MGFFNFLYKLSNICTNRKKLKFFIVVGLIFLLLLSLHSKGYCSTSQDDETLMFYQLQLQENFIQYMRRLYQNKPNGFDNTAFSNICTRLLYYQCYVTIPTGDPNCLYWVYFYEPNSNGNNPNLFTTEGTFSTGLNSGTPIDCMLGNISCSWAGHIYQSGGGRQTPVYINTASSCLMPSAMYMVRSTYITEFLQDLGYFSSLETTFSTNDQELQAITSAGFSSVNSTIQNQTNTMTNSINSATSSITNSIDSVENTLTDLTTDDTQVTFAQDTNQDLTYNFFSNLFSQYTDTFTRPQIRVLRIKFPFTNKYLTMNNYYFQNNILSDEKYTNLVALIHSFWWFSLGMYVLYDVYNKINKIKSGDLTNIENENITTQLL